MRAARFLILATLFVVGLTGAAMANGRNATPGIYPGVRVGIVPAMDVQVPPGTYPPGTPPVLGPDLYEGTVTITRNLDQTYFVQFQGGRLVGGVPDKAKLNVTATFSSSWQGYLLGTLTVGSSVESGVVISIDSPDLISANINGVGTVDHVNQRVIAKVAAGPSLTKFMLLKAPGNLR